MKEKIIERIFELEVLLNRDLTNAKLQKEQSELMDRLYDIDTELHDEIACEINC